MRRFLRIGALVALGSALSACGSPQAATTTTTTIAVSTTVAPSTTTSTTLPPNTPPICSSALLGVAISLGGASAGTSYYTVKLTNNGPSACSLNGFPQLAFFTPSAAGGAGAGALLDVMVQDAAQTPAIVSIAHGAYAEFLLFVHEVPSNGVGCTTVASIDVTPPGTKESITAPASLNICGGSVTVDPIGAAGSESP